MTSTIGIKIANGEFYSIVKENTDTKKRLILTTVHDSQESMQIDLYKSSAKTMVDAIYIGSIVVENIQPRLKGIPSVELIIHSSSEGVISAYATDLDRAPQGEPFHLSVSLKSLDEESRAKHILDYELEQPSDPPLGLYEKDPVYYSRGNLVPWVILGIAVLVLFILGLWFFSFRGKASAPDTQSTLAEAPAEAPGSPASPPAALAPTPPVNPVPAPAVPLPVAVSDGGGVGTATGAPPAATSPVPPASPPQAKPVPVISAPAEAPAQTTGQGTSRRERPLAPVSSYKVPSTIPRGGLAYTIRWGDTLWDIAQAFYRNPWLYPRIARYNRIRNPNLIISGTTIRIPPKN